MREGGISKRTGIIPLLIGFLASLALSSDKVGSVFLGADVLPENEYNETASGVYRLQRLGITVGIFVPLNLPFLDAHYKIKASTHKIGKRAWDWNGGTQKGESALYDKHASALNEILVGKEVLTGNRIAILPQLGLGFQLDALNQNGDSPVGGIVYSNLFADFSGRFRHRFHSFGLEAIANFQLCLIPSWSGYEATDRISVSLGIFK